MVNFTIKIVAFTKMSLVIQTQILSVSLNVSFLHK